MKHMLSIPYHGCSWIHEGRLPEFLGTHKEMAYIDCYEMAVVMFKCVPLIKLIKVNIVIISLSLINYAKTIQEQGLLHLRQIRGCSLGSTLEESPPWRSSQRARDGLVAI